MPAYNEQEAIEAAVADVRKNVLDRIPGSELLVVDDGSRDDTGPTLDRLAAADPRVRVLHKPNGGHGSAIMAGLDAAAGACVLLVDSDLQIPLADLPPLWQAVQDGAEGAFGVRRRRHDPPLRLALTWLIRRILPVLTGVRLYDANVPFKVLRRACWQQARPYIPDGTLAPSLFLAIFMKRRGCKIVEFDVTHKQRDKGVPSIRRWKLFKFCARSLGQLLAFRRRLAS
jgi:glycosyltransferase involved in cell wall biosynthesis